MPVTYGQGSISGRVDLCMQHVRVEHLSLDELYELNCANTRQIHSGRILWCRRRVRLWRPGWAVPQLCRSCVCKSGGPSRRTNPHQHTVCHICTNSRLTTCALLATLTLSVPVTVAQLSGRRIAWSTPLRIMRRSTRAGPRSSRRPACCPAFPATGRFGCRPISFPMGSLHIHVVPGTLS